MNCKAKIFFIWLLILVLMSGATAAFGAVLAVSSTGNDTFVVQGFDLVDVAGIDVTINYDTATLGNPRVSKGGVGGGAMLAASTKVPGTIRITLVTTAKISGNGIVASILFDNKGDSPGTILSLEAKIVSVNSVSLPVQTQVHNPGAETGGIGVQDQAAEAYQKQVSPEETGRRTVPPETEFQPEMPELNPQSSAPWPEASEILQDLETTEPEN
jgi:hypothetical protein